MSPLARSLHFLQAQPDSVLVALARDGHEPAFEALVRRYRKELLAYCRRFQPQSGGAEDAVQQALLQAWRALNAGAEVRDVRAWLYRIAHNVTLNQLRVVAAVPQELPESGGGNEVDQLVEQRMLARAALAGVASLPNIQRQVFMSATLEGASHEEVASSLGLSSGAVRGLIYRARATLRAAVAAITPSPALHWAIRRAESRAGGGPALAEALAGGGGTGVAAVLAKGGAVLTLAGAVAGTGGVILIHGPAHHHRNTLMSASSPGRRSSLSADRGGPGVGALARRAASHGPVRVSGSVGRRRAERFDRRRHGDRRTSGEGKTGRSGGSGGGSDGGSSGSDGGSDRGARTVGSSGDSATSGGGSSTSGSGSDDGATVSSTGSTSTTSGSDGGSSGGGPLPSDTQATVATTTSDGGSGSDGGSSGSGSSSGSGDMTSTTGSH